MRKRKVLTPNRYNHVKTSGSNKFVSTFSKLYRKDGITVKRDRKYNWTSYKWALIFALVIGALTYFAIDYIFF